MQDIRHYFDLSLLVLVLLVLFYYLWPYCIAFLTVVGAIQMYHVWRRHWGCRP